MIIAVSEIKSIVKQAIEKGYTSTDQTGQDSEPEVHTGLRTTAANCMITRFHSLFSDYSFALIVQEDKRRISVMF